MQAISDLMHRRFPEARTFVYGSEARGDAKPDSDVDLLILLPDRLDQAAFKEERFKILDAIFDLEIDLFANFSPLVLTQSMWKSRLTPFTVNVTREAIRL